MYATNLNRSRSTNNLPVSCGGEGSGSEKIIGYTSFDLKEEKHTTTTIRGTSNRLLYCIRIFVTVSRKRLKRKECYFFFFGGGT